MVGRAARTGAVCLLIASVCVGCQDDPKKPIRVDASTYRRMVDAFYTGTAAVSAGDDTQAVSQLTKATQIVPNEPAPWYNLTFLALKQLNLDAAAAALKHARETSVPSAELEFLTGLLDSHQNKPDQAIQHFSQAAAADPHNIQVRKLLIDELDRARPADADQRMRQLWEEIVREQPENISAMTSLIKLAVRIGDAAVLRRTLDQLQPFLVGRPPEARTYWQSLHRQADSGHVNPSASHDALALENYVKSNNPAFAASVEALSGPKKLPGQPIQHFLRLPNPSPTPSPADTTLTFTADSSTISGEWVRPVRLGSDGPVHLLSAQGAALHLDTAPGHPLAFPLGTARQIPPQGVLAVDWNNDFKTDFLLAGAGGVRLWQQAAPASWSDVTAKTKLPDEVLHGAYTGAWALDVDLDGDLDVLLGSASGPPVVLRNNGDGTWAATRPFPGVNGVRAMVWLDLDSDGDGDVAFIDRDGKLAVWDNHRGARYTPLSTPQGVGRVLALSVADADQNGTLDLVVLQEDGAVKRLSRHSESPTWDVAEIARAANVPRDGSAALFWADLDNNGALDLVVTSSGGTQVWLGGAPGQFTALGAAVPVRVVGIDDLNADGRLDLAGSDLSGKAARFLGHGSKAYRWVVLRPQGKDPDKVKNGEGGDERVNSFGIGGSMELRSALLVQKQPIEAPVVQFGIGDHPDVNVVRIVWPRGSSQAEFGYKASSSSLLVQRTDSSCPWLYAWDGSAIRFVTDILWSSPLGLRINAQDTAGVVQTRDWVRVRGDQLRPRDGYYDLRVTGELWETDIFDYFSLMTVDHPADTEIYLDERFRIPPPELKVHVTAPARPFAHVVDDLGQDVAQIVRTRDGKYLDTFGRGVYQGITRDHWVEMELPAEAPATGPIYLLATGWVHPTDSSINVAISQGHHDPPRALSVEVPDGRGGWRAARTNQGFPAGKNKTCVIDLTGIFPAGTAGPRRLRLRTNLEVYWDQLAWTTPRAGVAAVQHEIRPTVAELRYRGFSYVHQADPSSPELPDYSRVQTTGQMWRDLVGWYTRFGDVRELLAKVDDRYVLLNAGDEIALRFPEQPAPPAGWVRDYVFVSDGWDKDGNLNTSYSKTLLPLPSHSRPAYNTPPTRLEDDPVYRAHRQDWADYHTRYVTPDEFSRGLRAGLP